MIDPDAPKDEVIVEQRSEPSMEEMAEAFYWGTLHDYVALIAQYGQQQVMQDTVTVARRMAGKESEGGILLDV